MGAIFLLLAAATPAAPAEVDAKHQDIPAVFQGEWTLSPQLCKEKRGPAFVTIGPRTISFYERRGFLDLAQLNEATEPPSFYGRFDFAANLSFSTETVRLDLRDGFLFITESSVTDADISTVGWYNCGTPDYRAKQTK